MTKEGLETPSFSLPPSREVVFPGGLETLAEQQLGAGKLVVNERAIEANQQARELEELHQQEITQKVDQLEARTEVKPPYQDFSPSSINTPSYISAKTIEALAVALSGWQGKDVLPPVQIEALKPPQQKQEIDLQQAFPANSREKRQWREVTKGVMNPPQFPPDVPPSGSPEQGPVECIPVDDLGGCINEDLWDKQIAPGIVRTTMVEPGFSRNGVNSGTLQGHTTVDVRNRGKEVAVGGPDGKSGIIYNELSGQMEILDSDGQVVDKWSWSKVTVQFLDGSTQAFDSIMVGPK